MALEDVVHVLRGAHKALRPYGVALDLHPLPVHPWVEVRRAGRRLRLGLLDRSVVNEAIRGVRKRLALVERDGLFAVRARRYFDWCAHYSSIEDWFRRREEYGSTTVIPPQLLRRARVEMRRPGTTLVIGERTRATSLGKAG